MSIFGELFETVFDPGIPEDDYSADSGPDSPTVDYGQA